ncbi:CHCH domain protein (macronuclear) [Tetrahymena thermophila SB210]|uniref:CHCH domain protein n=1 Tax=Tetrahymena thermophila (strain SB210) TaxID=312017 RepID=W7XC82_TETTS|nr:CHCH domain protein [Tetrahymena thermophila SB210]EWS71326.1 CHCH domain protein [Tetrahymena thermophila SB210]|eukprot:XP_012656144.1 CHCH domain protein [Tetrahymena thermophila SB210]
MITCQNILKIDNVDFSRNDGNSKEQSSHLLEKLFNTHKHEALSKMLCQNNKMQQPFLV